jgi:hypothetical protein
MDGPLAGAGHMEIGSRSGRGTSLLVNTPLEIQ